MTILVFGQTGQVATELGRLPGTRCLGRGAADLADPAACAAAIRTARPEAVINAAAYTGVDRAEDEEALATVINGDSPGAMAAACAGLGVPLVQISTDYVFDGTATEPYGEDSPTGPASVYGQSKLEGEQAALSGDRNLVVRTSWIFGPGGAQFAML